MILFTKIFSDYFSVMFFHFLPAVPFFSFLSRYRIAPEPEYCFKGKTPFSFYLIGLFHCMYYAVLQT